LQEEAELEHFFLALDVSEFIKGPITSFGTYMLWIKHVPRSFTTVYHLPFTHPEYFLLGREIITEIQKSIERKPIILPHYKSQPSITSSKRSSLSKSSSKSTGSLNSAVSLHPSIEKATYNEISKNMSSMELQKKGLHKSHNSLHSTSRPASQEVKSSQNLRRISFDSVANTLKIIPFSERRSSASKLNSQSSSRRSIPALPTIDSPAVIRTSKPADLNGSEKRSTNLQTNETISKSNQYLDSLGLRTPTKETKYSSVTSLREERVTNQVEPNTREKTKSFSRLESSPFIQADKQIRAKAISNPDKLHQNNSTSNVSVNVQAPNPSTINLNKNAVNGTLKEVPKDNVQVNERAITVDAAGNNMDKNAVANEASVIKSRKHSAQSSAHGSSQSVFETKRTKVEDLVIVVDTDFGFERNAVPTSEKDDSRESLPEPTLNSRNSHEKLATISTISASSLSTLNRENHSKSSFESLYHKRKFASPIVSPKLIRKSNMSRSLSRVHSQELLKSYVDANYLASKYGAFDDPETDENVIVKNRVLRGATVCKLIDTLTSKESNGKEYYKVLTVESFRSIFLFSYCSFMTPNDFLDLLI
jgi:hypothetical protein